MNINSANIMFFRLFLFMVYNQCLRNSPLVKDLIHFVPFLKNISGSLAAEGIRSIVANLKAPSGINLCGTKPHLI